MSILKILISQTKVGDFANKVVIKKNITSCQVTMDYLQNILFYILNRTLIKKYYLVLALWKKGLDPLSDVWNPDPSFRGSQCYIPVQG